MKNKILQEIDKYFTDVVNLPDDGVVIEIENKIDKYHENHSLDLDLIIKESLILLIPPLSDYLKSLDLLNKINTVETVILKSIIQSLNQGFIKEEYMVELHHYLLKEKSSQNKAILYYLLALGSSDKLEKREYLNQSIINNTESVYPYFELAAISEKEHMRNLQKRGIKNVKIILKVGDKSNFADYNSFIDEYILGTNITEELFNHWLDFYKIKNN